MKYYDDRSYGLSQWKRYGEWLYQAKANVSDRNLLYWRLMQKLHSLPFEVVNPMDMNRVDDGLYLREEWGYREDLFDGMTCSVLEVLVALAVRIDEEYLSTSRIRHPEKIFMQLLQNLLDLDRCLSNNFDEKYVEERVATWVHREFEPDGTGSIFPLKNPKEDQRTIEIWSQMLEWISEKM